MSRKYYSGIGSRKTPPEILAQMEEIAYAAAASGWTLRSGGAVGADTAFFDGCQRANGSSEIFFPWPTPLVNRTENTKMFYGACRDAREIASAVHPYWNKISNTSKVLIARNVYQILGKNLDTPVEFVVCYTPDGCEHHNNYQPGKTGGTGAAIALASRLDIPVYNLYNPQNYDVVINLLKGETQNAFLYTRTNGHRSIRR